MPNTNPARREDRCAVTHVRRAGTRRESLALLAGVGILVVLGALVLLLPLWLISGRAERPELALPPPPSADHASGPSVPATGPVRIEPEPPAAAPPTPPPKPATSEPVVVQRRVQGGAARSPNSSPTTSEPPDDTAPALTALGLPGESSAGFHRTGPERQAAITQFGGTPLTENAVEIGLRWLAAHQAPNGTWDRFEFTRQCPSGLACTHTATEWRDSDLTAGVTGLCVLAFLGAGYTDREGPHQETVARGIDGLLRLQLATGDFSTNTAAVGYDNALATFALAEYLVMTRDERVRPALERAVRRIVNSQQPLGGWTYLPDAQAGRNDTSITAWMVQALQTAAVAGIKVPRSTLALAALHITRATESSGRVWYADAGTGYYGVNRFSLQPMYRYGPAMVAAGMTSGQLLGWRNDTTLRRKQRALLLGEPPSAAEFQGGDKDDLHGPYYWYYGTIAMFQSGGDQWDRWNAAMRDALLPLQDRDKNAHTYGSFQPFGQGWGKWGRIGGRVYTTAIGVLTLEIYYRHTPAYLDSKPILTVADWRALAQDAGDRERELIVHCLDETRIDVAEPVLVEICTHAGGDAALAAALALAELDSPIGRPVLEQRVSTLPPWQREAYERALRHLATLRRQPPATGRVRVFDAQLQLGTLDLPRAYAGMLLDVQRGGQTIAQLRVLQRFSGRELVLASLLAGAAPNAGDTAVEHRE